MWLKWSQTVFWTWKSDINGPVLHKWKFFKVAIDVKKRKKKPKSKQKIQVLKMSAKQLTKKNLFHALKNVSTVEFVCSQLPWAV